jgi:hypothetical protein
VKSNPKPWTFPNKRSVKWLMENPMPVFLCVVNKAALKLQLYHTCPRFHIWSLPVRPDKLELIPGTEGKGECVKFEGGTSYSLSAPILALTINDIHNENSRKKVKDVLKFWIGIEEQNLRRVKNKILQFSMPDKYETNAKPGPAVIRYWSVNPSAKDRKQAISSLEPQLTWVAQILWNSGDMRGAVRALLLHRHWFGDLNLSAASALRSIHHALNIRIGKPGDDAFEAIDELGANLDKELEKLSNSSKITMG